MSNITEQLDSELAGLVETVHTSLVEIRNGHRGAGAGTIWHAKGLIVTNAHVVGRGDVQVILPDGRMLPGRILAKDSARDLAAIVVEATNLPTIQPGDSERLQPGQWVMAMGHPYGVNGAITAGVVIGLGPAWAEERDTRREWVLVSLHLWPGHSGGPLVDKDGHLIGVNSMINGPDVGMAVPVHEVRAFLRETLRT